MRRINERANKIFEKKIERDKEYIKNYK